MGLRDRCKDSLGDYYLALNPSYDYVPFQQERIVPVLEGVECGDIDRLMIFMPAGHAKTQMATKAFIPWYLGRNPKENVILLCHTQPLAKDFGSDIRNTMTKNEAHRQVFPDIRVDSSNHASDFFKLNKGGAFYAFGMDGGMTGRRADLIMNQNGNGNWDGLPIQTAAIGDANNLVNIFRIDFLGGAAVKQYRHVIRAFTAAIS